jgi:hypothetical protein
VTAPGDGEVTVVADETMGEKDPLLARLLAAATAGAAPAGPANKRKAIRIVLDPDDRPVAKGKLCAQDHGFNLHAATKVAANDKQGRLTLCKYILRPPLANDRLKILDDGNVRLEFKKPWSDGTSSVELEPLALIARLAALVPPPKAASRQIFWRTLVTRCLTQPSFPHPPSPRHARRAGQAGQNKSKYIPWAELAEKTFGFEIVCSEVPVPAPPHRAHQDRGRRQEDPQPRCTCPACALCPEIPELHPARPPPA